jgi:hypothetical protein
MKAGAGLLQRTLARLGVQCCPRWAASLAPRIPVLKQRGKEEQSGFTLSLTEGKSSYWGRTF